MKTQTPVGIPVWKHIFFMVAACIGFVLSCVQWAFVYLDTLHLRACYKTPDLLATACAAGAPYKYISYKPPAGNAQVYYCVVLFLAIIVYYIVRSCCFFCYVKNERKIRRESMGL